MTLPTRNFEFIYFLKRISYMIRNVIQLKLYSILFSLLQYIMDQDFLSIKYDNKTSLFMSFVRSKIYLHKYVYQLLFIKIWKPEKKTLKFRTKEKPEKKTLIFRKKRKAEKKTSIPVTPAPRRNKWYLSFYYAFSLYSLFHIIR